jgi:hypothetical protein
VISVTDPYGSAMQGSLTAKSLLANFVADDVKLIYPQTPFFKPLETIAERDIYRTVGLVLKHRLTYPLID